MHIKYVDGHYKIVSADNGQFIQSADIYPGMTDEMLSAMADAIKEALN